MQRKDFEGVFKAMDGFPVTIRTLDPPLHEFLPRREDLMVDIATLQYADAKEKKSLVSKYRDYGAKAVTDLKKLMPMLLSRSSSFTNSTPCSDTAVAGSASLSEITNAGARHL